MLHQRIQLLYRKMNDSKGLQCIRNSLIMIIPILLIDSFAIVLQYLPIAPYQTFMANFGDGILLRLLGYLYNATGGMVSVYLTVSIALSYAHQKMSSQKNNFDVVFTALICFAVFSGVMQKDTFSLTALGPTGMFTAIVCGMGACFLYEKVQKRLGHGMHLFTEGADETFQKMVSTIFPMLIVVTIFILCQVAMTYAFGAPSFHVLFQNLVYKLFEHMGRTLGTTILYEFVLNGLWFFGIHGGDVCEHVTENIFNQAVNVNQEQIAQGLVAKDIFNGPFVNTFVAMGGCGTIWCLLLAILIFSKRRSNRKLAGLAVIPSVFNISEFLVLGLPVAFNPIFFVPFIVTPVVMVLTTAFAMSTGLVPVPIHNISWTTPVIMGGYLATDSIAGAVLQVVNLAIGTLIYAPFVKIFDEESVHDSERKMTKLVNLLQRSELENRPIELLQMRDDSGATARLLADDMQYRLKKELPIMYYQPQYSTEGKCIGVEALLRWTHPTYGTVYPPLVIRLAEEAGILLEMEEKIFHSVLHDTSRLLAVLDKEAKISINITGETIQTEEFLDFLEQMSDAYPEYVGRIILEITEQATLQLDDTLIQKLTKIREMGYELAIDDFSMGNTSIKYLQTNIFSLIKLDGSISKSVVNNERSRGIVASITKLASDFGLNVLAEYVESEEQKEILAQADCRWYQGSLYHMAMTVDELEKKL